MEVYEAIEIYYNNYINELITVKRFVNFRIYIYESDKDYFISNYHPEHYSELKYIGTL